MVKGVGNDDSMLSFLPNLLTVVSLSVQPTTRWADMSHSGNAQRLDSLLPSVPLGVEQHQKYFPRLGSEFTHLTWWKLLSCLGQILAQGSFTLTFLKEGLHIPETDINQERNQESRKRGIKVFFQRHTWADGQKDHPVLHTAGMQGWADDSCHNSDRRQVRPQQQEPSNNQLIAVLSLWNSLPVYSSLMARYYPSFMV